MAKNRKNAGPPKGHALSPKEQPVPGWRSGLVVVLALAALILIVSPWLLLGRPETVEGRGLSEVLSAVDRGNVDGTPIHWIQVDDGDRMVILHMTDGSQLGAHYPAYYAGTLIGRLESSGLVFETDPPPSPSIWGSLLMTFVPVALIIGFLVWFARRSGMGGAKAFTTAKAELGDIPTTRFSEVVGCDEAVEELAEIVTFLHEPERFAAAGARMPRGFLLVGPPGTGKTLLARAVAGEAGVPFYAAAGSDFTEMFVGVGAARVRNLFAKAKKTGGIVFLDELDSIGRTRTGTTAGNGGTDERESTLNALLVEMDGFGKDSNVIVIAATNRPDVLDSALLRAGRFDREVNVAPPDRKGRTKLLELYTRHLTVAPDVDFVALARRMPGLTGADIANLANQAALEAARAGESEISNEHFAEAIATAYMGKGRKSAEVPQRSREITAWHEAGHALAALLLPDVSDPVQVTIIPRGISGGATWYGVSDETFKTGAQARAELVVALAGRAAEEILLDGDFTQGASNDIAKATELAQTMVASWGMSSLGLAAIGPEHAGSALVERVHAEADALLTDALARARALLAAHRPLVEVVVAELLAEETIDLERLLRLRVSVEPGSVETAPVDGVRG
ncbi:MAG TPA: AAA family ATPase [Acidimicrobiia bacterium]|nr:AAA family ATPase [Acidimicrobiia bacterium]